MSDLWAKIDLGAVTLQSVWNGSSWSSVNDQENSLETINGTVYLVGIRASITDAPLSSPPQLSGEEAYDQYNTSSGSFYIATAYGGGGGPSNLSQAAVNNLNSATPALTYWYGGSFQPIGDNQISLGLANSTSLNEGTLVWQALTATGVANTMVLPTGASPTQYISDFYAPTLPASESSANTAGVESGTINYPSYVWVDLGSAPTTTNLFTTGADTVNFNNLTSTQQSAIASGADLYHGLGGNDVVTLPSVANYNVSLGSAGGTLDWNLSQTFSTGSLAGDTYSVTGSDGSYNIALGAGSDTVTINGNGNSNITAGSGSDAISITGNGNNTVTIGSGNDIVTMSGTGNNTVTDGGANGVTITQFQGALDGTDPTNSDVIDFTKLSSGNMTIGSFGTGQLDALFDGSVTFSGIGGVLQIDGSDTLPTGVINGFIAGDTIDFRNLKWDGSAATILQTSVNSVSKNNVLYIVDHGQIYGSLQLDPSQKISGGFSLSADGFGGTEITPSLIPVQGNPNLSVSPNPAGYSTNASIYAGVAKITDAQGDIGSGFIIGPHSILTAAHVAWDAFSNPASVLSISVGGVVLSPISLSQGNANIHIDPQWSPSLANLPIDSPYDLAIIDVQQQLPGSSASWFSLLPDFAGGTVNITGYAPDVPGYNIPAQSNDIGTVSPASLLSGVYSNGSAVTYPGDSGGPLWVYNGSSADAVGLVSTGATNSSLGFDTQITSADVTEINQWEQQDIYLWSSKVINHYISGATVFADANGNGQLDPGEASTVTDSTGGFSLTGGSGPLIAFGGTDTSTGLAFKGQLSAPAGSTDITPLTTLLTNLASDSSAEQKVLSNLGLSSTLDLTTFDPIAAALGGSADGAATELAGEKVYDTVEMIASALAGVGGTFTPSLQAAYSSLASALDGAGINLSDKTALSTLFTQVARTEGITLGQGTADTIATVIAAGNAALDHVMQADQPGAQLLSDAAGVELVEQGAVSTALANAGGNSSQLQSLANLFTGTNLNTLITQAQTETQNSGQDLGPIAYNGTATTDQNTVVKGSVSAFDLAGNSITYTLDGSAPAGLTFNSDGTFSFDPGGNYKYLALGESTTLSFKFDASDGQGTSSNGIETITINGLNDSPTIDGTHTTVSGTINELPHTTGSNAIDKASGVIAFSDPDLSDRPTATIDTKDETFSYQDSSGHAYSLTPAQIAAFEAAISVQSENGNTNSGKIDWVFSFADRQIDFLGAGESVTATIPVVIDDHNGGTVTQDVVITIDGANDNPVAAPDSNGVAFGRTLKVATDNGVLANDSDPDIHDKLTVEAVDGKTKAVGHAIEGKYGWLTLNADGSYTYKADYDDDHGRWNDGRWDDGGGVKQDSFTYTVSDGHGGLSTSTLSIVVFESGTTYLSGADTTLTAGKGPYVLDGSAGGDTLKAGNGHDVLIGGNGDSLVAGHGQDNFLFRPNFGTNTISNFNVHDDTLQFDHSTFSSLHDLLAHTTDTTAGAVISDGHGDTVTLLGIKAAQLHMHQDDFHLV